MQTFENPPAQMRPILRPGHVELRVHDLNESLLFYRDVLGLVDTGEDPQGRRYLKAWDERDHSSVVLTEADRPGLDVMAFKVRSETLLDPLQRALLAADLDCERLSAGTLAKTGERLRVKLPSGHLMDLYGQKMHVGNGLSEVDPPVWHRDAEHGIGVSQFDHAVLYGPCLSRVRELFKDVLGFHVTERVMAADATSEFALWLSSSQKPADVVFVEHSAPGMLHRLAFRVDSAEQVLRAADIFSMNQTLIDVGPFRDPVARRVSVQAFDPSGNRIEIFWGGYACHADAAPVTWTWKKVGASMALRDQRTRDRLLPDLT